MEFEYTHFIRNSALSRYVQYCLGCISFKHVMYCCVSGVAVYTHISIDMPASIALLCDYLFADC